MKKLNIAIIGQGRSGRNIHGGYFRSEANKYYNVKYVVDADAYRRDIARELHPGCETFADYRELFKLDDIDLVVNATCTTLSPRTFWSTARMCWLRSLWDAPVTSARI